MSTLRSLKALAGFGLWRMGCCIVRPDAAAAAFGAAQPGSAPEGWICGGTGGGKPVWSVAPEGAASKTLVLKQSGKGRYPWCVKADTSFGDDWVGVRFKALAGKEDQAGGIVWRWKDGDNYYVARANALENNASLYYTQNGARHTLKYQDAPVASNTWHVLRVEFKGARIRVLLNGKAYIEQDDVHIAGAGKVGVWTKADSVTLFDAFAYKSTCH